LDGALSIGWTTPQSSVTLASSVNPAAGGAPISLTATVTGPHFTDRTPTGTVSFTANGQALGTVDVDFSGRATLTDLALPTGTSSIQATYHGDAVYAASTSDPLDEQIVQPLQALTLSAAVLPFAPQIVGQSSPAQTLTATNTGAQPVGFTSVQAAGAGYETSANTCQGPLAPGLSCTVQVSFIPTGPGPVSGAITLTDDAGSQTVTLTGSGITAATPVVTAVNPPAGYTTGGTVVTISGNNLDNASSVTFGGTPATAVRCTPTSCTATSPAAATFGVTHIQVTTPAGSSPLTLADRFAYLPHG